ncbi:hypothetical protein HZF24_03250 [Sedimentibacter hydroxybenzoicus DSM 7310]|uniref:Uncharacterized protein n=1 Tax=Sedimentibacter hydroxybenzoicus DSM 7310 TaxID=1123245 RepID=A0A974BHE5_SEDHY|nr:hypothetical protein [Sedimentibacter hydroxybenzoicus]NYB73153.1 hypothetical protein [Sedimentibacter hydroxybenzoicus DSM 7310]
MKKIGKKLSAILFVALCCVLLFPITAMAEEIIEEPIALPETMTITKQLFSDSGELEPEKITIKSHEDGRFYFEYPANTVSDMRGYGDNHSITAFHVEGRANYRIDKEMERKFGATDSRWIVGKFSVPDEIVYTVLTPSVSENYSNVSKFRMVPYEGSLETTSYDDEELEHHILFKLKFHCTRTETIYDVEGGSTTNEHSYDDEWTFDMETVGFSDPYPIEDTDSTQNAGAKGKWEYYKPEDGGWGFRYNFGGNSAKDADHAGPLATITISILAILLSILFGNTGGFIPTVPVGTGGAPAPVPSGSGLSRWLRFDGDGDIEATDPVNGQKRTFVQNGDGTYTDPVSGATYTPEELSEQLEHRADNAGTIRQDEAQFRQNISEDSQRNQERSDESSQLEKDLQRERQERSRKEKVERVATDLGMSGASEKQVIDELKRRMERDEDYRQKMNDYAQRRDTAVDILEATVDIADYTMAAGEAVVPGGKTVSATYKGIKNTVSTMAEKGASWGSFTEGAIKGGTEAATTVMDAGIGKAATAFGGTVAGEVAQAVNDGGDLTDALVKGTVKGTFNAASGAVGDAYGDAVGGTYGEMLGKDSTIKKVAETAGKLGEVGFEKNVTGTVGDNLNGENK